MMVMTGEMSDFSHHPCAKLKRRAEEVEELEIEQPISKRLARMRIDQPHFQPSVSSPAPAQNATPPGDDRMYLDDTKDKIYIHDLASEIAQIEAEEPQGIFLPDIEKKISAIPQKLLQNQGNNANTQMVLYRIPSSITVPTEQDHVRRAIIASRARARENQAQEGQAKGRGREEMEVLPEQENSVNGFIPDHMPGEDDSDAMELG